MLTTAERKVKIIKELNSQFTKDETRKKKYFKSLQDYRKNISNSLSGDVKETLQFSYRSFQSVII